MISYNKISIQYNYVTYRWVLRSIGKSLNSYLNDGYGHTGSLSKCYVTRKSSENEKLVINFII